MRLSASQLGSWERCPRQFYFERVEQRSGVSLSRTAYGTVVHHALHAFERAMAADPDGIGDALATARATFDHYWNPANIGELTDPVEQWIGWDSYGRLRQRGLETMDRYANLWRLDDCVVLSLEHPFEVPVQGTRDELTGEPHTISGFVDRLVIRRRKRVPVLDCDDYKTGVLKPYLRQHLGLTVYCYATTQREFWEPFAGLGYDPDDLFAGYADYPRHANWYDLNKEFRLVDAGYRGPQDYHRLAWACSELARSVQAEIFPLRISGETCGFCPHAAYCPDGTGVPDEGHGAPPEPRRKDGARKKDG